MMKTSTTKMFCLKTLILARKREIVAADDEDSFD